jgi:hypothetical protein
MLAQSPPSNTPPAFEVASVKPAGEGHSGVKGSCHGVDSIYTPNQKADAPSPGRCVITNARLSHLINIAWDLQSMALLKSGRPISLRARAFSMAMLVSLLSRVAERGPGIDKTGLEGVYDFTLSWDEDAGPSLTTALREQLGLRMESQKVPVSFFVVDSAQRPAEN